MQAFEILEREGVVPSEQLPDLRRMLRFRNLVAHDCLRRDDVVIGEIALERLGDFSAFVRAVRAKLQS